MPNFIYKAKKGINETITGAVEAETRDSAVAILQERGLFPVSVEETAVKEKQAVSSALVLKRKLGLRDLNIFTRQLMTLVRSRVDLISSLNLLHSQADNKKLKAIISDLLNTVKDGKNFSEGLNKYPDFFPLIYVNIIKAGEVSGKLDDSLSKLSEYLERELDLRMKVSAALAYPLMMIVVGIMTIFVLFTFVIPRIIGIFDDFQAVLPLPTRILLNISNFMHSYWLIISGIFVLAAFAIRKNKNILSSYGADLCKLHIPILGRLTRQQAISRFAHTLSLLLRSGIPIFQSLTFAIPTLENKIFIQELESVHKEVLAGSTLANSLKKATFIPPFIIQMISVGEAGGRLQEVLDEITSVYTKETEAVLKIITSLIEPVVILCLGLVLGLIIMAMLLPIFQINMLIK